MQSSRAENYSYPPEIVQQAAQLLRARQLARQRGIIVPAKPEIVKNVPDCLFDFVEQIRPTLKVDNEPFTWEGHEYLIEPYRAMAVTGDHNPEGLKMVLQCGAQVGKTVFGFMFLVWAALRFWGKYFGYFLPDQAMAMIFSDVRFKPTVRSIPEIRPLWGEDPTAWDGDKRKTDQKRVRSIGPSQIFFSYMQGQTSTESIPMLAVVFDEIRKMLEGDIERAEERMSHSPYPINFKYSTAGYPDANIDKYFKQSNQHKFHSNCGCKDGVVLSDVFPDCIGDKNGKEFFYICPTCKTIITNPRDGRWIAHNPSSPIVGYHIPQTLSCRQDAGKILRAFQEASDLQEFYNSKLGVPYLSPEAQIVTTDILRSTVNVEIKWLRNGTNFAMGIDQMGGFNVIVVRYWGPKCDLGVCKSRLAHLEIVYGDDPWERADELMRQFDISACVADALPNINEARRFAQRWPGRVWLADYSYESKGDQDICEWGDRPKQTNSEKKSSDEIKNRYTVRISRYHGLEWNLMKYVHRLKEQPHECGLVAEVKDNSGRAQVQFICEQVFWVHLQKLARRKEVINEAQGKYRMVFENIGIDPHFAHADLYAELALSRVSQEGTSRAFGSFVAAQAAKPGEHAFVQLVGTNHWECTRCDLKVRVLDGTTPEEVAAQLGRSECRPG